MQIDWRVRPPRSGVVGIVDRLVGPASSPFEDWIVLAFVTALTSACLVLFSLERGSAAWWHWVVVLVVAVDLSGGVVANATAAAKRWYHRPGQGPVKHLLFVAAHGGHLALIAWLFADAAWPYFLITFGFLIVAAAIIVAVPLYVQRPVAFGFTAGGLMLGLAPPLAITGMEWFLPLLWLKLLLAHLVHEAPFAPAKGVHR